MVSLQSALVGAIRAMRRARFAAISSRTKFAPTNVLPHPLPLRISQPAQSPGGGNWFGRAFKRQLKLSASLSCANSLMPFGSGGRFMFPLECDQFLIVVCPGFELVESGYNLLQGRWLIGEGLHQHRC